MCIVVCELQMLIGNAEYQCSCVRYVSKDNIALIIGLSVGLVLLLIIIIMIIIIIALVLYCRRKSKQAEQKQVPGDKDKTSMTQHHDETHYSRQLPDDCVKDEMPMAQLKEDNHYNKQLPDDYNEDSYA